MNVYYVCNTPARTVWWDHNHYPRTLQMEKKNTRQATAEEARIMDLIVHKLANQADIDKLCGLLANANTSLQTLKG